jgi:hypothetical protein
VGISSGGATASNWARIVGSRLATTALATSASPNSSVSRAVSSAVTSDAPGVLVVDDSADAAAAVVVVSDAASSSPEHDTADMVTTSATATMAVRDRDMTAG